MTVCVAVLALLLALATDRLWGEPPVRLHPVVWMGNYLSWAGRQLQRVAWQPAMSDGAGSARPELQRDHKVFWLAALYWSAGAATFGITAWWLQTWAMVLPDWLAALMLGLLLKPMLAWAMLKNEVLAVEAALGQSLQAGRERLSWLVSRDVSILTADQVRESAIESLAENLNDSVVAPIFWFLLLGLPGAVCYRFANTADAMWGYKGLYKGQNWEWAGKWAARADDVLNWMPARLTGVLLAVLHRVPLRRLCAQAGQTPSPNSGWPMAAMALALDIRLGKPGVYTLNPAGHVPQAAHLPLATIYALKVLVAIILIVFIATFFIVFYREIGAW